MKKRITSLILCFLLVVGILPLGLVSSAAPTASQSVSSFEELQSALENDLITEVTVSENITIPGQNAWTQFDVNKKLTVASGKKLTVDVFNGEEKEGILFNDLVIRNGGSLILEDGAFLESVDYTSGEDEMFYRYSGRICVEAGGILDTSRGTIVKGSFFNYSYGDDCTDSDGLIFGENNPENLEFSVRNEAQLRAALQDGKCTGGVIVENDLTLSDSLSVSKYLLINDSYTFNVPSGNTLTLEKDGFLQLSGELYVYGTFNNYGEIFNLNVIDVIGGTFSNCGVINGISMGEGRFQSEIAIESGATINNFISNKQGVINDYVSINDEYRSSESVLKSKYNALDGDMTFSPIVDDNNNPQFDIIAYVFDTTLIQTVLDKRLDFDSSYSIPAYEVVIVTGPNDNNIIELGGIRVPTYSTFIIAARVFDGVKEYHNEFKISEGTSLILESDSLLVCSGKGSLTIDGDLDDRGANIDFRDFKVYGKGIVDNVPDLISAFENGGSYRLINFSDAEDTEEYGRVINVNQPVAIEKDISLVAYNWDALNIPGMSIAEGVTVKLYGVNLVLSSDSEIKGTFELCDGSCVSLYTPESQDTTSLVIGEKGRMQINPGCGVGHVSDEWEIHNNGTIINLGGLDRNEEHYFGNDPVEYVNLRDLVCDLYYIFNGYDNMVDVDYETESEYGLADLHWVYDYPDGGNTMFNFERPEDSDFDALGAFSWFIKNGVIPEYDEENNPELHPYKFITNDQAADLINKLANKIAGTKDEAYTDISGDSWICRTNIIYLENEDRYTSEFQIILDNLVKQVPVPSVNEEMHFVLRRFVNEFDEIREEIEGTDGNRIFNRRFTKPVIIENVTEECIEDDNWGGMVFFDNCIFEDDIIIIYNDEFNYGVEFSPECSILPWATVCTVMEPDSNVFCDSRVEIRNVPENTNILALTNTEVNSDGKYYVINGLPVVGNSGVGFECNKDHGEVDYNEIDHNNCGEENWSRRLEIYEGSNVQIFDGMTLDVTASIERLNNSGYIKLDGTFIANDINNHCWWDDYENEEEDRHPHMVKGCIDVGENGTLKIRDLNNETWWEGEDEEAHQVDEADFNNNGSLSINKKQAVFEPALSGRIYSSGSKEDTIKIQLTKYLEDKPSYTAEVKGTNSSFEIKGVETGLYVMNITKNQHDDAKYYVAVIANDVKLDDITLTYTGPVVNPFKDIPEKSWYTTASLWCYEREYITGTKVDEFSPSVNLTRAMFVQILAKVANADLSNIKYSDRFSDVPEGKWFTKAVLWAAENGVTKGTSDTTFSPSQEVSREQFATFLFAYSKSKGYDTSATVSLSGYSDVSSISKWAKDAVTWAIAEGLISGTSSTEISPKVIATRAQAAVIFKKYVESYIAKQKR